MARQPPETLEVRALVVNSRQDAARSTASLIKSWGYTVKSACDLEEAWRLAPGFKPHVAFIDVEADGMELAQRFRKSPQLNLTTLVAMTGGNNPAAFEAEVQAGFDFHFVKPMPPGEVQSILGRVAARLGSEQLRG